jgi:hypothetical protein
MERYQVEGRDAQEIARELTSAFNKFCSAPGPDGDDELIGNRRIRC